MVWIVMQDSMDTDEPVIGVFASLEEAGEYRSRVESLYQDGVVIVPYSVPYRSIDHSRTIRFPLSE